MKILVTGGCGFVGSNLVDQLIEDGHKVTVWDNFSTGKLANRNALASTRQLDVSEVSDVYFGRRAETRFDLIYHMAALARIQPSFLAPSETFKSNVIGTERIMEVARSCNCPVIYAGSSSFYHCTYANPYTFTKWQGEQICTMYNKVYKVPVAIARFFNVYGPRQLEDGPYSTVIGIFERQTRLRRENGQEKLTITGDGEQRRDFTHVADIVKGLIAMSQKTWNAEVFNLGTGQNHSINELAAMFVGDNFDEAIMYLPKRPGEADTTLADIAYSKEQLGWEPVHKLEDYVKEFLENLDSGELFQPPEPFEELSREYLESE